MAIRGNIIWLTNLLKEQNNSHFCPGLATRGGSGFQSHSIPIQQIANLQISFQIKYKVPSSATSLWILSGGALSLGWGFSSEVLTLDQQCPVVAAHLSLFLMRSLVVPPHPTVPVPSSPLRGRAVSLSPVLWVQRWWDFLSVSAFAVCQWQKDVCQWLPEQGCEEKNCLIHRAASRND